MFHEETSNRPDRSRGPHQVAFQRQPEDNRPITFKEYGGVSRIDLPLEPLSRRTGPATEILSGRTGPPGRFTAATLARVLAFSAGITRVIDRPGMFLRYFRAASSAHSYPDVYVVCGDLDGIPAGVHYFHGLHLRLDTLRAGDFRAALARMAAEPSIARRPATLVIVGVPWRAAWRYGERALRHVYWDTGGLVANMGALADADGVPWRLEVGFVDADVAGLLGVDGVHEFPVALVEIGDEDATAGPSPPIGPLEIAAPRISSGEPLVLPLILDAQRAGGLQDAGAVSVWRAVRGGEPAPPAWTGEMPRARGGSMEEVILRRGSTRRMLPDAVARSALDWILAVAARSNDRCPPGADRTLLQHVVVVHAVDGLPPGVYRYGSDGLRIVREGELREDARYVSLKQAQAGDGAFTTFHLADLDDIVDVFGARGYRAAQLEGGFVLERLHLAASALGIGATGLTFWDEEVAKLCLTSAAVMTEVAVGRSAYRALPGGLGEKAVTIKGRAFELMQERSKELEQARRSVSS